MTPIKSRVGLFQGTHLGRGSWKIIVGLCVVSILWHLGLVIDNLHGNVASFELGGNQNFPNEVTMTNQTRTIPRADPLLSGFQGPGVDMLDPEDFVRPTVQHPSNHLDRNQSKAETLKMREDIGVSSFVDVCTELLRRSNGTLDGAEPWRASGGLSWTRSPCGHQGLHMLGNHLSQWYIARAIASDAGISIQSQCPSPITDLIPQFWEPNDTILDDRASFLESGLSK